MRSICVPLTDATGVSLPLRAHMNLGRHIGKPLLSFSSLFCVAPCRVFAIASIEGLPYLIKLTGGDLRGKSRSGMPPPRQARRRRPGRAPRTCSRTPPRAAAPPRDEISLRNNLVRPVRLPVPSPPARPARPRRPPRICFCVPPPKRLRNPPRMRLRVPAAVREGAAAHAAARAGRRRRPRPGRGRQSPPPGGGASRAPCSA